MAQPKGKRGREVFKKFLKIIYIRCETSNKLMRKKYPHPLHLLFMERKRSNLGNNRHQNRIETRLSSIESQPKKVVVFVEVVVVLVVLVLVNVFVVGLVALFFWI